MAKYHVGKDGQARPCKAASPDSCPLAKADESGVVKHFDSLDAAQSYGERVAMGLVGEDSSHAAPVAGMRDDGRYVDDSGYVYPREGEEWSDDDRAAYAERAVREALEDGLYGPGDPAFDDLKSIAAGEWGWEDVRRECRALTDYGQYKDIDRWWDALDSKCPVLDVDGNIRVAKDPDRVAPVAGSATDDEISEYVRSANANALRNDVSIVSSVDVLDGCRCFDAATAEEKALIRESLDRADAAVASGDFEAANDEYTTTLKKYLGYNFIDTRPSEPALERLADRCLMADFAVDDGFILSMEDLPNDRAYDEVRDLEPGTFSITKDGVIPLDLDDDDYDYEDGIYW